MKTGRNQPCPCGSGKKYKHCCLIASKSPKEQIYRNEERQIISSDEDLQLTYYIVCVIDILGQKNKLAKWSVLPNSTTLPSSLFNAMKESVGVILNFQKIFKRYFHDISISTIPQAYLAKLPKEKQEKYSRFKECRLGTRRFADTFVFYAPLANLYQDISIISIHRIIGACCTAMLVSLGAGIPVRGGICMGTGVELSKHDFYGPALAEAHYLEHEIAQYPRVVVSEQVHQFLQTEQIYSDNFEVNNMIRRMANACKILLSRDKYDDKCIVDFLGSGTRSLFPNIKTKLDWIVARSHQFVITEKKRFLEADNEKLVGRYTRLQEYIESRLDIWGLRPDTTEINSKRNL